jgi:hypothetical protein
MLDIEKYTETFKESVSKRLDGHEDKFKNLAAKIKFFEETQREYKKRLSCLEDGKYPNKDEYIELQNVKNFQFVFIFLIVSISIII